MILILGACNPGGPDPKTRSQELVESIDRFGNFSQTVDWGENLLQTNSVNGFKIPLEMLPKGLIEAGIISATIAEDADTGSQILVLLLKLGLEYEAIIFTKDGSEIGDFNKIHNITNNVFYVWSHG